MKKILLSITAIGITLTTAIGLSYAFFSDTESSSNNVLEAGKLDLKIDNESYYNGVLNPDTSWSLNDLTDQLFFNFTDIKPSDIGEDTISIHIDDNNAWACMWANLTQNDDNTCTEPELLDDPTCTPPGANQGELAQNLNFIFWVDDGDNLLETGENVFKTGSAQSLFTGSVWPLQDSITNLFEVAGPLLGAKTYYIGKAWCFGTLTQEPLGGVTCNGSLLDNATQTDIVKADISFSAYQARNNPNFVCVPQTSPTPTPTATPVACQIDWADTVISSTQGKRKNGTAVLLARSNPAAGLVSQSIGNPFDTPIVDSNFFSLGFPFTPTLAGTITVKFNSPFINTAGPDLKIYEVTGGPPYPDEKVKVEVSPDNITYTDLGIFTKDSSIEMIIPSAQYVRLTEASVINSFETTADGYDLDGIQALCATGQ